MARQRLQTYEVEPEALKAILAMEKYTRKSSLDLKLRELVKIRASQLTGYERWHVVRSRTGREPVG